MQNESREGGRRVRSQASGDLTGNVPLVSIVLVFFNGSNELEILLNNLRQSDLSDAEVIVIDGGSHDGTVDLLQASEDVVHFWLSEPDSGIYDAMNKGVAAARGEYLLHLNAGDRLCRLPLEALRGCLADDVDVASFGVMVDGVRVFKPRLGLRSLIANTWHHQGTFYRRSAHLGYNPSYRVYGDFEHNQRLRVGGCSVRLFPEVVAEHTSGGASTAGLRTPSLREVWRAVGDNAGRRYVPLSFAWLHLYFVVRWLRNKRRLAGS